VVFAWLFVRTGISRHLIYERGGTVLRRIVWLLGVLLLVSLSAQALDTYADFQRNAPIGADFWLTVGHHNAGLETQADVVGNGGRFSGYVNTSGFYNTSGGAASLNQNIKLYTPAQPDVPGNSTGTAPLANTTRINLWCVDNQLSFEPWKAYQANILTLNYIGGAYDIRYENLPLNGDGFANPIPNNLGVANLSPDQAAFRYRMAIWLVTQYEGAGGAGDYRNPLNNDRNKAIQHAAWAVMDTTGNGPATAINAYSKNGHTSSYWFNEAATWVAGNFNHNLFKRWAVVSAWNTAGGLSNNPASDRVQTFLTEVPEPGFYGLLALGLSGLFVAIKRRRASA
jgi:hypothetical protein